MIEPTTATSRVATTAKITIAAYLISSSRVRPAGTVSRQRRVPRLASPAMESPEIALTAKGRKSGSSTVSAANATKSPLPVIALTKSGPPPRPGDDTLTAMEMITGTTAKTAIPARFRRRPKMIFSSESRNRARSGRAGRADREHLNR